MIQSLDVSEGKQLAFQLRGYAAGFHEKLDSDHVCVIELFLCLASDWGDVVDTKLELILLEKVEKVLVDQTLGEELQHF